ncbi:MAG: DUF192 domain-containing protein [SAR202 cluster bacterium]|nr:DUF192 domain-containing protein [SAR202 cluster bacterium]MDP6512069.1 DUF192 domain-containing protein [SAR202 cluster bacterium]
MIVSLLSGGCVFGGDENSEGSNGQSIDASPTPTPLIVINASSSPTVSIADHTFDVEVAFTADTRDDGLAGRDSIPDMTGMIYVYESGETEDAWMKGMRFPLDFMWIDSDCRIIDTHPNAPIPPPNSSDRLLPTYWSIGQATYVLEVNAGTLSELGIRVGDPVSFGGFSGRGAIC